jgi:hypothetical protein
MYTPSAIRVVRIALRLSLAAAFLSAVADRFGWWEPFGRVAGGAWVPSPTMPTQLVPFASGWLLAVIVWASTATEATLGFLLLDRLAAKTRWRGNLLGAHNIWKLRWLYPSVWNHRLATVSSSQPARPRPTRYLAQHRRRTPLTPRTSQTQL